MPHSETMQIKIFGKIENLEATKNFEAYEIGLSTSNILTSQEGVCQGLLNVIVPQYDAPLIKDVFFYVTAIRESITLFGMDERGIVRSFIETEFESRYKMSDQTKKVEITDFLRLVEIVKFDTSTSVASNNIDEIDHKVVQLFWEEINANSDDPYINSSDLEEQFLQIRGDISVSCFETLLQNLLIAAGIEEDGDPLFIRIEAATEEEQARLSRHEYSSRLTEWGYKLLDGILDAHSPSGWTWEYNDGRHDRRSGYDMVPIGIEMSVDAPSALERAEALQFLLNWIETKLRDTNIDLAARLIEELE